MDDTTLEPAGASSVGTTDEHLTRVRVVVAGLLIELVANDPGDLDLLHRVLGSVPGTPSSTGDVVIEIGPSPALPDRSPDFEGPYGNHWDDGTTHWFGHSWGLSMRASADHVLLGGPASGFERWVAIRNAMLFALARIFLARNRFVLHGAGIARGSTALIIVGDSGSGKSSLAFAAQRHGWDLLGDDMVVVDPSPLPFVQGVPRVPSIPGDLARAGEVTGEAVPHDERQRVELVDMVLSQGAHRVCGIIVAGHGTGDGSIEEVAPPALLEVLVPSFVLSALPAPVRDWFPVAMSLSRLTAVCLRHASDPADRVRSAGELLDRVETLIRSDQSP